MRQKNSLRARLTIWFTTLLIALGLLGGAGAYLMARQDPDSFLDDQLRQIALNVGITAGSPEQIYGAPIDPSDVIAVQVWDGSGHVLRATPPGADLPPQTTTGFSDTATKKGGWRTYTLVTSKGIVQVSQQTAVRQELAVNAALPALVTAGLLIPLSWLLVRWLVGRILRPLDKVALQLSTSRPESTQPLIMRDIPEEILPLVTAMNKALARLSDTLVSQKRFVSDAAHQLRTPLTALRLQMRNLARAPGADTAEVLADMELGLQRMSALTSQLLTLARVETPGPTNALERISLSDALNEAGSTVLPLAQNKDVSMELTLQPHVEVLADRNDLITLLSNLIDNAVRYTAPGGSVTLSMGSSDGTAMVEIADTGSGLPNDMIHRVFDRFVRFSDETEGTGLGLSIVKAIAERIDARVSLRNRTDRPGLTARVEMTAVI